jgi:hypothetical protein
MSHQANIISKDIVGSNHFDAMEDNQTQVGCSHLTIPEVRAISKDKQY